MSRPKPQRQNFGTDPIPTLVRKMAVPASIGILVMSIYFIVDTIFVGRFVGTLGIAALTVVMPINFLISSMGMAVGVGGSSVLARAFGADDARYACHVWGNMVSLMILLILTMTGLMYLFTDEVLTLFGARGDILPYARTYFRILLVGVPALGWAMMANNVMRAEGAPKMAMWTMMIPAVGNILLDPILILGFDLGIAGAGWATTISYFMSAAFTAWYFFGGRSDLRLFWSNMRMKLQTVREILSIGVVTLARQGTISLLGIVLNNALFQYGQETAVAIYGIIGRVMMFANFPVLGITQGFLPIVGFNYGAGFYGRVRAAIRVSIKSGTLIAVGIFVGILAFAPYLVALFTEDVALLAETPRALRISFIAVPLITAQLVGSAYFQAVGKATPALFLTLTKQGFFLIPFVLILPRFFGLDGIWYAFPVSDVLAAAVTLYWLRRETQRRLPQTDQPTADVVPASKLNALTD